MGTPETDEMLRVLLLSEDFYPIKSGGAFLDWNVAKYLSNHGDKVTVVTLRTGSMDSQEVVEGVEIRRPFPGLPDSTPPNSFKGQLRRVLFAILVLPYLFHLVRRHEFDVIYSTNHLFHPIGFILGKIFHLPLITFVGYSPSIRNDVRLSDPLVLLERMNFLLFMGDRALCQTPSIYREMQRLSNTVVKRLDGAVNKEKIYDTLNTEFGIDSIVNWDKDSCIQLIFVGRLTELKNPTILVRLLTRLPQEYSLLIIGDGPQRVSVEAAITEADVSHRVHLAGSLPHKQTLRAIYESDLLVLPSEADAYPAVVFEALSLNTPVLATPVGVLPSIKNERLTTVPLGEFRNILPRIDTETEEGIDDETLERFSADRLASEVRQHMLVATEQDHQ